MSLDARPPNVQVIARVAVLIILMGGSTAGAQTLATGGAVSPLEWADLALAHCRAAEELEEAADGVLAGRLASIPRSREQAAFLAAEPGPYAYRHTRTARSEG